MIDRIYVLEYLITLQEHLLDPRKLFQPIYHLFQSGVLQVLVKDGGWIEVVSRSTDEVSKTKESSLVLALALIVATKGNKF